jgi:hypothetical protein
MYFGIEKKQKPPNLTGPLGAHLFLAPRARGSQFQPPPLPAVFPSYLSLLSSLSPLSALSHARAKARPPPCRATPWPSHALDALSQAARPAPPPCATPAEPCPETSSRPRAAERAQAESDPRHAQPRDQARCPFATALMEFKASFSSSPVIVYGNRRIDGSLEDRRRH